MCAPKKLSSFRGLVVVNFATTIVDGDVILDQLEWFSNWSFLFGGRKKNYF